MAARWARSADEAVEDVRSGQTLAIGGFLGSRHPMALVRALLRRQLRDLTLIVPGGGIDADQLIASGAVRRIVLGLCSLGVVGAAPHFRRAAESGAIEVVDYGVSAMYRAFEAAWRGHDALPARYLLASSVHGRHPARKDAARADLIHIPALKPDVALIHAERVDRHGDARFHAPALDVHLAWAAKSVIVSTERVLDDESLRNWGHAGLSRDRIAVIVETPWGAHPSSCYPDYASDIGALAETVVRSSDSAPQAARRFAGESEADYLRRIPVTTLMELQALARRGGFLS